MQISTHHLNAFLEVSRKKSFSKAAEVLHVTQSALSQRILNLEEELGSALFIREPSEVRLTELGEELLKYSQIKETLEAEFLNKIKTKNKQYLGGIIRLGGFSTVMRSIVIPSIKELVLNNPDIQIEICVKEIRELQNLLRTGEVDYLITNYEISKTGLKRHLLGYEENVLIEAKANHKKTDVYLDHDMEDTTTEQFFRLQKIELKNFKRSFLDDIYGIIDGVSLGFGRAIVPRHLVKNNSKVIILEKYKSLKIPVILHYYEQPFYSKLHNEIVERLSKNVNDFLS